MGSRRTSGLAISGVVGEILHDLGGLERLDRPGPVQRERVVDRLAAERCVHLLVVFLRPWRGHAVGHVEARQRRHAIQAAVLAVDEPLPARLLEERVRDIGPGLDVLGEILQVVPRLEQRDFLAVGVDHPHGPSIERHLAGLVDEPHVVGPVGVRVGQDGLHVRLVLQDDVRERLKRELRELDELRRGLLQVLDELRRHGLADAARDAEDRVDHLACHLLHDRARVLAGGNHLSRHLEADLADDAEDVALSSRRAGADDEVGTAQVVEVEGVVLEHEEVVEELPDLVRGRRRVDVVEVIERARRCHVVRTGTHAADPLGDAGHLLGGPPDAEALESPQLRHLEVRIRNLALVVEEDLDLSVTFEAGDWIDRDSLSHGVALILLRWKREVGSEKR